MVIGSFGRIFLLVFFLAPVSVQAQIIITEIMHDPEGKDADSGGEWIEVLNVGEDPVDLSNWKFFENETHHNIKADADGVLFSKQYAIISQDLSVFRKYFPAYSGLLFKASFSLNESETISMKSSKDMPASDSVFYFSSSGANDDGNSLQRSSDLWIVSIPTPGYEAPSIPAPVRKFVASKGGENKDASIESPSAEEKSNISGSTSSSSVVSTVSPVSASHQSSLKWILLLGGVVIVAIGAYWTIGRKSAEEFEIIDESDEF